jgi:hypothetical protein
LEEKAMIARLLAVFGDLSENNQDAVLKFIESLAVPKTGSHPEHPRPAVHLPEDK